MRFFCFVFTGGGGTCSVMNARYTEFTQYIFFFKKKQKRFHKKVLKVQEMKEIGIHSLKKSLKGYSKQSYKAIVVRRRIYSIRSNSEPSKAIKKINQWNPSAFTKKKVSFFLHLLLTVYDSFSKHPLVKEGSC